MNTVMRLAAAVLSLSLALVASTAAQAGEFPDSWYFHSGGPRLSSLRGLEGRPAPALSVRDWIGEPQRLSALKGKVVVVDFWGTWCPPCMASLPKNVALMNEHRDDGFMIIGVHDSNRGSERMSSVASSVGINYPLAVDNNGKSVQAWRVSFWPTYAVLDRKGVIRAIGLQPEYVGEVVERLLDEGSDKAKKKQPPAVPERWLEGNSAIRARLEPLRRAAPPALRSEHWLNGGPLDLASLKGKVVLLDFWATWCAPCKTSIPTLNTLAQGYGNEGLVIIGICDQKGAENMAAVVSEHGVRYTVCADTNGELFRDYKIDGRPDYYLIDREGRLRIADLRNDMVQEAVEALLAESAPAEAQR